jgi:hypothetical protein
MGTRIKPKKKAAGFSIASAPLGEGPIAQILHPDWLYRDSISRMSQLVLAIDSHLTEVEDVSRAILTGGGFIQISESDRRFSELSNEHVRFEEVHSTAYKIAERLKEYCAGANRDLVIGLDLVINNRGVGQFAISLSKGQLLGIVWKSYPVMDEWKWLAGFGVDVGMKAPRFVDLEIGKTMILVCHDSQAFNHRNKALVARANRRTPRMDVMDYMDQQIKLEKPSWALNVVHYIGKPGSIRTFSTSYKQIGSDFPWPIKSVGAFGYARSVRGSIIDLARKMQFPYGNVSSAVIVDEVD